MGQSKQIVQQRYNCRYTRLRLHSHDGAAGWLLQPSIRRQETRWGGDTLVESLDSISESIQSSCNCATCGVIYDITEVSTHRPRPWEISELQNTWPLCLQAQEYWSPCIEDAMSTTYWQWVVTKWCILEEESYSRSTRFQRPRKPRGWWVPYRLLTLHPVV